jgi:hypothetical protein
MASSSAKTVEAYLKELPAERRREVQRVREVILANLPPGYSESMAWGMITWGIPLERYATTYNGQPLGYAALAAQKNYFALYLLGAYMDEAQRARLQKAYDDAGRRMDMGKSCLRFRTAADLPLELIGELIASTPVDAMIARYEEVHPAGRKAAASKATAAKKSAKRTAKRTAKRAR